MLNKEYNTYQPVLAGKRIGVFGKGGAGKSTFVVLLARSFRYLGYEVFVLDADSTNIGLPLALGMEKSPKPLLDYFGGMVFSGGRVTCPVDDPTLLHSREILLDELPPQYYCKNQAGITIFTAGKIGADGPGSGCDGPISKIARDLVISKQGASPVTLVDFKAGFEDTARGVITSLDWAIVLVDPTIASIEMAVTMRDRVDQIKNGIPPATQHLGDPDLVALANKLFADARIKGVFVVLNKIRDVEMEGYLREKLSEHGIEPAGMLTDEPSIAVSWLNGTPLESGKNQKNLLGFITKLEAAQSQYGDQSISKVMED